MDRRQLRRSYCSGTKRGVTRSSGASEEDLSDRGTVTGKGPRAGVEKRTPKRRKARGSDKGRSPQSTPGGSPLSGPLDIDDPAIAAALESQPAPVPDPWESHPDGQDIDFSSSAAAVLR